MVARSTPMTEVASHRGSCGGGPDRASVVLPRQAPGGPPPPAPPPRESSGALDARSSSPLGLLSDPRWVAIAPRTVPITSRRRVRAGGGGQRAGRPRTGATRRRLVPTPVPSRGGGRCAAAAAGATHVWGHAPFVYQLCVVYLHVAFSAFTTVFIKVK